MPRHLTPEPSSYGIGAPVLGPWFSSDVELPAPLAGDLAVQLSIGANESWLPPATGTFGLLFASAPSPLLDGLHAVGGGRAFPVPPDPNDARLVALFRLLPEVEERLYRLAAFLPSAGVVLSTRDESGSLPTRPRVRYLAIELPETFRPNTPPETLSLLGRMLQPPEPVTDGPEALAELAERLGFALAPDGTRLINAANGPMTDLKRPGRFSLAGVGLAQETMLTFQEATAVTLWAFDARGRPVDAGAVAAWWHYLATTVFDNLWAEGLDAGGQRTCRVAAVRTLHMASAHEGPIAGEPVRARLIGADAESPVVAVPSTPLRLQFSGAPEDAPDDAPHPLLCILPDGVYSRSVDVWPGDGWSDVLVRDMVRVAVVDVEAHLVGQRRIAAPTADDAERRRAAAQQRESTRVSVERTSEQVLLATTDDAVRELLAVFDGSEPTRLVAGALDLDWGPLEPMADLPDRAPPARLQTTTNDAEQPSQGEGLVRVRALAGSGILHGTPGSPDESVTDQRVAIEVAFAPEDNMSRAWVRVWTQGFNLRAGRRVRLDGGAGRVTSDNRAYLVAALPDGDVTPGAPMGLDVQVKTARGLRLYMDLRFQRPAPIDGAPVNFAVASDVVVCESGELLAETTLVPPGSTLLARSEPPAAVRRESVPRERFAALTLSRKVDNGDVIELTPPLGVFSNEGLATAPAGLEVQFHRLSRSGSRPTEPVSIDGAEMPFIAPAGSPPSGIERFEIVCARTGASEARAVMATTPALSRFHELGLHREGHPGAPAAAEFHGTGVKLSGPAAVPMAVYTRERTFRWTWELVKDAADNPMPALHVSGAGPFRWCAVLRTVAKDVEAEGFVPPAGPPLGASTVLEPLLDGSNEFSELLNGLLSADHPEFGPVLRAIAAALPDGPVEAVDRGARAIERRLHLAVRGAKQGLRSMLAAIERAEDFIYIETPVAQQGEEEESARFWPALRDRMQQRPALRLIVCLPVDVQLGQTDELKRRHRQAAAQALAAFSADTRVAVFSPAAGPGRNLYLASTTVIVDDVFALTGTTHLSDEGLSRHSSLATAVFDEAVIDGRPREVRNFRLRLTAERLGVEPDGVPDDPVELVAAVRELALRGGAGHLALEPALEAADD